jgi:tetratricopeptide (TPR) repeat protein
MDGKRLGPFRVGAKLGSGGMGTVYGARLLEPAYGLLPGAGLAVKVIHPHLLESGDYFERFLREAGIGSQIRHENVVEVFGVETAKVDDHDLNYIVMAHVKGRTLRQLLDDLGTVPEVLLREIGRQVADGLGAIHEAGIIHRDIKPDNVILTKDDQIRIMDLGMARLVEGSVELTLEGHFAGSLLYAAPEQLKGGPIGPRADLYALGVLLYELATGINPFRRDVPTAVMVAQLEEVPTPLKEWNPRISAFFSEVVMRLLQKDETRRIESADALAGILEEGEGSGWWAKCERSASTARRQWPEISVDREARLLGREAEREALIEAFCRARSGEGNAVLIQGEPGIGKTRLVDDFLREGLSGEATVLYGAFVPFGGQGAISEALVDHFGATDLEASLGPYLPETAALIPSFACGLKEEGLPSGVDPLAATAVEAVTCQLMQGLARERPLVWILDDLHFAEPTSRKTFLSLARAAAGHRVLLIATSDQTIPGDWLSPFTGLENADLLPLGRLGARDVVELIRQVFKSEVLTDRLGARIAHKSDGVPLFVFEIIRGLREQGLIESRPDGTCVETAVIDQIEVPSAVRDMIENRLTELSDEDRTLLDVAAVMGHRFEPDLVARARGMKRVHVLERLASLERRFGVIRSQAGSSSFDHHQIQEVIYDGLIPDLKAEYHTLLADALAEREAVADRAPEDIAGETMSFIAFHHLSGVRPAAGLPLLVPALEFLLAAYRHEAVLRLANLALAPESLLAGEDREAVLHRKATALDLLGRREEERAVLREVVTLAEEAGASLRLVHARRRMGWNLLCVSRPEDAREWLTGAATLAEEVSDRLGFGLATLTLGTVFWSLGRYDDAEDQYARAYLIAVETGDRLMEARARGNLANVDRLRGRPEQAREHLEEAVGIFRELGDRTNEGAAEGNLGNVFADLGLPARTVTHQVRAIEIAREIGDRTHEGITLLNHGGELLHLGDPEGAEEALLRARGILEEVGARLYLGYVLHHHGEVAAALGDDARAEERHEGALALFRAVPHPSGIAIALLGLGDLYRDQGQDLRARRLFTEASELGRELGEPTIIVLSLGLLAAYQGGNVPAAEAALAKYEPRLGVRPRMRARFLLHLATGSRDHLEAAERMLTHLTDHSPLERREALLQRVPLHRAIRAALEGRKD